MRILAATLLLAGSLAHAEAPALPWKLRATHPHSASDFTQGLVWAEGRLFESTGQYGSSRLLEKELASGDTLEETRLAPSQFAEGLTVHAGQLWQLTWREGLAHVYDLALNPLRQIRYRGEGWGLTSNGEELIVSDGSPQLYFIDPASFAVRRSVVVRDGEQPVPQLNELEWVDGVIYANIWHSNRVARIDPATGTVTGWLDFAPLVKAAGSPTGEAVLNGLAWDAKRKRLLVTGKYWPKLFEVSLGSRPGK